MPVHSSKAHARGASKGGVDRHEDSQEEGRYGVEKLQRL